MYEFKSKLRLRNEVIEKVLDNPSAFNINTLMFEISRDFNIDMDIDIIKELSITPVKSIEPDMSKAIKYLLELKTTIEFDLEQNERHITCIKDDMGHGDTSKAINEQLMSRLGYRDRMQAIYDGLNDEYVKYFTLVAKAILLQKEKDNE